MDNILAIILAGGGGERVNVLAQERAKPAIPFAAKYRIINFTLSNCAIGVGVEEKDFPAYEIQSGETIRAKRRGRVREI